MKGSPALWRVDKWTALGISPGKGAGGGGAQVRGGGGGVRAYLMKDQSALVTNSHPL